MTFFDVSREQYELLLSVGDLQQVRLSVREKRNASEDGAERSYYDAFLDKIDLRMMKLAERCARLGLDREFAWITQGFPSPSAPDSSSRHMVAA